MIHEVDGLRFVAISLVVFFHIGHRAMENGVPIGAWSGGPGDLFRSVTLLGGYGVHLFFVLSGFLLALPFARAEFAGAPRVALRTYFARRLSRLEPPYVLVLAVLFLADAVRLGGTFFKWPNLLAGIGYQHTLMFGSMNQILGAAWSLEVEAQFYVSAPLLALVFTLRRAAARRAVVVCGIVTFAVLATVFETYRWQFSLPGHLHEFLAGFLLADLHVVDWKEQPTLTRGWDAIAALGWAALPLLLTVDMLAIAVVLPFLVLALFVAALRGLRAHRLFAAPWVTTIGGMCYTIYLLHGPITYVLRHVVAPLGAVGGFEGTFLLYSAVMIPSVLLASFAFFVAVERPCMDPKWPRNAATWLRARAPGRLPARTVNAANELTDGTQR